jgi:hypothetical protein
MPKKDSSVNSHSEKFFPENDRLAKTGLTLAIAPFVITPP